MKTKTKQVLYLSGAPRVSTRSDAEMAGPRAHVLGVIAGFEAAGFEVERFIVGDRLPRWWSGSGSEALLTASVIRTLTADLARIALGWLNGRRARKTSGEGWIYERFATLQGLGRSLRSARRPWIIETNGIIFAEAHRDRKSLILSGLARRRELKAYRDCDILICISERLKEILVREGISEGKIVVVPNGVDVELFDPRRQAARRWSSDYTIGSVGYLIEWQRLDLLISAVARLRSAGIPVSAVIVGDGPERANLEATAQASGAADAIHFVGRVPADQVPGYIAGFDVGYSATGATAGTGNYRSPLKLYEYMAMAKPVISSRCADARELVEEGRTGFFFEDSVESVQEAILRAHAARQRHEEMGALAREVILRDHSWAARVRTIISEVESRLGEPIDP